MTQTPPYKVYKIGEKWYPLHLMKSNVGEIDLYTCFYSMGEEIAFREKTAAQDFLDIARYRGWGKGCKPSSPRDILVMHYQSFIRETIYQEEEPDEVDRQTAYRVILVALTNHNTMEKVRARIQKTMEECGDPIREPIYQEFLSETEQYL